MKLLGSAVLVAALAVGGFTASSSAATIAEVVSQSGGEPDGNRFDYDLLLTGVIATDLVDALADPDADLTVWAPNDWAFFRTAKDLGYQGGYDEQAVLEYILAALTDLNGGMDPIPLLKDIILYHVAGERIDVIQVILRSIFGIPVDTLQGGTFQPFFFRVIDAATNVPDPRLFFPLNLSTDNGIIHTVNRILIPIDL